MLGERDIGLSERSSLLRLPEGEARAEPACMLLGGSQWLVITATVPSTGPGMK